MIIRKLTEAQAKRRLESYFTEGYEKFQPDFVNAIRDMPQRISYSSNEDFIVHESQRLETHPTEFPVGYFELNDCWMYGFWIGGTYPLWAALFIEHNTNKPFVYIPSGGNIYNRYFNSAFCHMDAELFGETYGLPEIEADMLYQYGQINPKPVWDLAQMEIVLLTNRCAIDDSDFLPSERKPITINRAESIYDILFTDTIPDYNETDQYEYRSVFGKLTEAEIITYLSLKMKCEREDIALTVKKDNVWSFMVSGTAVSAECDEDGVWIKRLIM